MSELLLNLACCVEFVMSVLLSCVLDDGCRNDLYGLGIMYFDNGLVIPLRDRPLLELATYYETYKCLAS